MLACVSLKGMAQEENSVTGKVVDKLGNPVAGALVSIENNPLIQEVTTDRNGLFAITAGKEHLLRIRTGRDDTKVVPVTNGKAMTIVIDFSSEKVNVGFGLNQTNAESTGAVSTVYADQIDNRSSFGVGNSLYGNVTGLTTMQKTGTVWDQIPSMTIRGLQTLNGNNGILLVVDGLERDNNWQVLNYITPEEVESVSVLRDARQWLFMATGVSTVLSTSSPSAVNTKREKSISPTTILSTFRRVFRRWQMLIHTPVR